MSVYREPQEVDIESVHKGTSQVVVDVRWERNMGEGKRVQQVMHKLGEGEQPGQRCLLANGKGGGMLCPP